MGSLPFRVANWDRKYPLREEGTGGVFWFPSGVAVEIQGIRIRGGLIYVGDSKVSGDSEVSLIGRDLLIGMVSGTTVGMKLPLDKPVAYRELSWGARAAYLHWLAGGRDDPDVEPSFVLLYLSGLERRVLRLAEKTTDRGEELRVIRTEVQRLADRYGFQKFFAAQATRFLSLIEHLSAGKPGSWKIGGGARSGQKTYHPINPGQSPVHHDPPTALPSEKVAPAATPATTPSPPPPSRETVPENPTPHGTATGDDYIDRERLARVRADSRAADQLLADLWESDDSEEHTVDPTPAPAPAEDEEGDGDEETTLKPAVAGFLAELVERRTWPHGEAKERARGRGLMLDAALAAINEFAIEQCDTELVETEGGLLTIDSEVLEELDLSTPHSPEKPRPPLPPSLVETSTDRAKPAAHTPTFAVHAPRWVSRVEIVRMHGRSLAGGMFYYGTPPKEGPARGAVIDPALPVGEADGEHVKTPTETKDYADLSPDARASFLDWLANGRRSPSVRKSFLFLFLHGLEHRVLADLGPDGGNGEQLREVLGEVGQLAKDYVYAREFHDQALAFRSVLEWLVMGKGEKQAPPSVRQSLPRPPESLFLGLGRFTGPRPLPSTWALAWVVHDSRLRPEPKLRFSEEFHAAFRRHFHERFPTGMRLPESLPELRWRYRPSNPYLSEFVVPTAGAKDLSRHLPALQALQQITRAAAAECATTHSRVPVAGRTDPVAGRTDKDTENANTVRTTAASDTPPARRWSTWKAPGTQVVVGNTVIPGGMLYVGYGPGSQNTGLDFQAASAIDIWLDVRHSVDTPQGEIAGPVTGYPDLTPEQRGRYLLWLQDRQQSKSVPLVFPRLFVHGIERRIVEQIRNSESGPPQITGLLLKELEGLLATFGDSPEFTEYVRGLLDLARQVMGRTLPDPGSPPRHHGGAEKTPFALFHGLGVMAKNKAPLPAEWAIEWATHHLRPHEPEEFRRQARARLDGVLLPRRMDLVVPDNAPDLLLSYEPTCPGLGRVETRLKGIKDLTGVAPPTAFFDRLRALASELDRREQAGSPMIAVPQPPRGPKPPTPSVSTSTWTRLALETARHGGAVSADHRVAIMRGAEELGGLDLSGQRLLRAHTLEEERPEEPATLITDLQALDLRPRERAADFLLDVLDAGGPPTPGQVEFLLAIHQRLGLEAVLRLRLSHRGIAPAPSGPFDHAPEPQNSPRPRKAPFRGVQGLSEPHGRLLADLSTRQEWNNADFARLCAWYGTSRFEALHNLNKAARSLVETDVLDERSDTVVMHTERAEEMIV